MSGGTEAVEHCKVAAGFMAWCLIQVALEHLMKNKMVWHLIQAALAHLMKMATCVCTSATHTKRAQYRQELSPSKREFAISPGWDLLLEMIGKYMVGWI